MENMNRVAVIKSDRSYKLRYEMYKKLFLCMCGISVGLVWLLVWALNGALRTGGM